MAGRAAEEFAATRPLIVPASRTRVGVVLAAGRSERLAGLTRNGSKALIRLGGLTLVERAVRGLLACGIEDVVVVVGHQADGVTAIVDAIAPGRVRAVHAEGWEKGNGASLAVAEPYVADEELFALVTVDHIFGAGSLEALLSAGDAAALVDERPPPQAWGEGTRVVVEGGRAIAFGKQLDAPTIDCGAFLLPAEIFRHQRLAAGSGDSSLAAAVTSFAGSQRLQVVPLPTGTWWHDVDTREDVRIAQRMLRRALVKPTDGPVSRLLNRPISTRLSVALAALRPAPDLVSVLALLLGIVAAGALAGGWGVAGGVLVHVASIVDGMDGELARLQLRERPLGAFFDGIADRLADAAILAGVGVWALDRTDGPLVVWLTVAAITGSLLSMASKDRIAALGLGGAVERGPGYALGGRDGRLLLVTIGAIAGQPLLTLIAVTLVSTVSLVLRALAVARRAT
ncbi:MAG TPA: NTP transferase domain-containing protein [Actinomycetota bacterium]|nr:NTP transferase domain-containing protein [Actinomycetota bacterium]